jgi:hypothetical protein
MWLVIGLLSLGLGVLALVGLLVVAKELIFKSSFEADSSDDAGTTGGSDVARSHGPCVMTR